MGDTKQGTATLFARPVNAWPVIGLRGQHLGTVEQCAIDPEGGAVSYLVLRTPWQTIDIDWPDLEFDQQQQSFKLIRKIQ
jgi:sporulation protein YlmC with PRC-barrel domain